MERHLYVGKRVKYLLDSVILIEHFNGMPAATGFIERYDGDSAISVTARAEVPAGSDDGEGVRYGRDDGEGRSPGRQRG